MVHSEELIGTAEYVRYKQGVVSSYVFITGFDLQGAWYTSTCYGTL